MDRRLRCVISTAMLLGVSPSLATAQQVRTVVKGQFEDAPLSNVTSAFSTFAGRRIIAAPDVGDPHVTVSFAEADWRLALVGVLDQLGLVASMDSTGVIRVTRTGQGTTAGHVMADYRGASLRNVADALSLFSGKRIVVAPEVGEMEVTLKFEQMDWRLGLDFILDQLGLVVRVDESGVMHIERKPGPLLIALRV